MEINTTKYLTATRNLTLEQRGFYVDLIIDIYENGPVDYSRLHSNHIFGQISHLFVVDGVTVDHEDVRREKENERHIKENKRRAALARWGDGDKDESGGRVATGKRSKKRPRRSDGVRTSDKKNVLQRLDDEYTQLIHTYKEHINPQELSSGIRNLDKLIKKGEDVAELLNATKNYLAHITANKTAPEYRIRMRNFFGREQRWLDYKEKPQANKPQLTQKGNIVEVNYSEIEE